MSERMCSMKGNSQVRHFNPASFVADAQITSRRNGKEENANGGEKKQVEREAGKKVKEV